MLRRSRRRSAGALTANNASPGFFPGGALSCVRGWWRGAVSVDPRVAADGGDVPDPVCAARRVVGHGPRSRGPGVLQ